MGSVLSTEGDWVGQVLAQLLPSASEYSSNFLKRQLEPAIRKSLTRRSQNNKDSRPRIDFRFEEIFFGSVPPKIRNVKVRKEDGPVAGGRGKIVLDFDFDYDGDCHFRVALMGVPCGVRDVKLSGRARAVLVTTSKSFPFVGGVQLFFLDEPALDYDLQGAADICDRSVLRNKVRADIARDVAKRIVYPNKVIVPTSEADPMVVKCLDPSGVIRVQLVGASGLPKKSGLRKLVGQHKPDAYATVKVGASRHVSEVVKNTTEPSWQPVWYDFLIEHPVGLNLRIDLYDEDTFSNDEYLGNAIVGLDQLLMETSDEITMPLADDRLLNSYKHPTEISGDVSFRTKWLPLSSVYEEGTFESAVVAVFVYSCNNLVALQDGGELESAAGDLPHSVRVDVTVNGATKCSEVRKKTQHPSFDEFFTFTVNSEDWSDSAGVVISVVEVEADRKFGEVSMTMLDLIQDPRRRRVMSISDSNPMLSVTFSATLKFAYPA